MSSILRAASKPAFTVSRVLSSSSATQCRKFHSPFAALGRSPLASATTTNASASQVPFSMYEKQLDTSPEPILSNSGTRTYVVSEPDATSKFHEVPSGAYNTSSPYKNDAPQDRQKGRVW
ncbi:hypothetical protein AX16_010112 [Volvariella volvacea WC 439]|nr:hypothetical protein AX16_010112 [Volvariella volvacea WC 439]